MYTTFEDRLYTKICDSGGAKAMDLAIYLTVIPLQPISCYILNIKMTSQLLQNFCIELQATCLTMIVTSFAC